jgi:hypothetical protein
MKALPIQFDASIPAWEKALNEERRSYLGDREE